MNFINLQVFWWIPAILIFMSLLFWRARVRRTNIMRLILGPRAKDDKHVQLSLARRLFRFLLLLFLMLMLIIAIARPTWKLQLVPYQSSGRDLMVLFDVSKSMLAQDIRPSRLAHAKLFLRDLVNQTGSDRFGLVAFAGRAFLECPMTTDKTSFIQYIDELDTESIPLGGTNLQLALATAIKAFDAAEGNNRAIILITDGDELSGNSKLALAELKKANIPLLIVGVGSSATPALIPIPQGKDKKSVKFMRDSKGELVKTRLNVTLMQQLADTSGGYFVHSTTTNFGLSQIEAGIKKLLPEELEKGEKTQPVERFYYFLAFATIILCLWMLISEHPGKKRKHVAKAAAVSVIFLLLNTADAQTKLAESKAEKPAAAITNPVQAYNEARKIQLKKGKKDSSKLYETAINLAGKNPTVRTNSFNNLGVKQHEKARQAVEQAIAQVKQQNLDGAISQLEGTKKILDLAEEMYIKALSTEIPESPDEDKKIAHESARNQSAINQQLLLNDRVAIDKLIKQIKELKKQQKKAQKQTKKAQDQQKKKNKQDKKKQQQKQQDKKQKQKKDNKQNQQQKKQDKKQQKQDNKQKQKKQDKKQQQQKQKSNDELKKAQDDVNKLEKQAKKLGQKKIEEQAKKAKKELKKAKEARKEKQGKKAEDHIKKALEQLKPKGSDKDKKKQDKKGKGKDKKDKKEKKDKGEKDKKKDKGKDGKDKKLPKPQPQAAKQGEAKKAPKEIDPKEARKLLKLMTEKEKDFRKALKAHRKQQYKNIKVEKDW